MSQSRSEWFYFYVQRPGRRLADGYIGKVQCTLAEVFAAMPRADVRGQVVALYCKP